MRLLVAKMAVFITVILSLPAMAAPRKGEPKPPDDNGGFISNLLSDFFNGVRWPWTNWWWGVTIASLAALLYIFWDSCPLKKWKERKFLGPILLAVGIATGFHFAGWLTWYVGVGAITLFAAAWVYKGYHKGLSIPLLTGKLDEPDTPDPTPPTPGITPPTTPGQTPPTTPGQLPVLPIAPNPHAIYRLCQRCNVVTEGGAFCIHCGTPRAGTRPPSAEDSERFTPEDDDDLYNN